MKQQQKTPRKKARMSAKGKRIGRPPLAPSTTTLALRVPDDLVVALDRYIVDLASKSPGFVVTRNDAMRRLLIVGLKREGITVGEPSTTDSRAAHEKR